MAQTPHVLVVTLPSQGNMNPGLHFAKQLIKRGIQVTFATTVYAHRRMSTDVSSLNIVAFSDGHDEGYKLNPLDADQYMSELTKNGMKNLRSIILSFASQGRAVTCLVYSILLPWAIDLARELHIPSAFLWAQPATVFSLYYYYFNGYKETMSDNRNGGPEWTIQLPGLPLLSRDDLPSFMTSSPSSREDIYSFALPSFEEQIEKLEAEENPRVFVNTFDALEPEALNAIGKYKLIGVGPLIPSAFLDGEDPTDTSSGVELFAKSRDDYIEWLSSKPESSVVYVSFGSLSTLSDTQMEEIAKALLDTRRPYLWVIKESENREEKLSCIEELEKQGKIVPWCSQLEVLTHPSLGCFVTHCGWNSTLESLACGVPVVAFPLWSDQATNAKLIQDVWRTGVRVTRNADGIVASDDIKRCLDVVMDAGERGQELRRNAKKWKGLAKEAMHEGGSSHENLKSFVEQIGEVSG